MDFGYRQQVVNGRTTCVVEGEVDLESAHHLKQAVRNAMQLRGPDLVLDLSAVTFLDCAGLGALLALQREARAQGGHVALVGTAPAVTKLLRLTGLESWFLTPPAQVSA